ncbi:unnamed protein product [Paramecium octaurelia]|uniref:Actin-fragmin kinase catalytic domain-containing protein n=1 Tax=Paramecium octaurelia TaxID=43137 RepID=A0A8S1SHF5_PAROT|nr:unnamed protein product [Paramecium octaurelia]
MHIKISTIKNHYNYQFFLQNQKEFNCSFFTALDEDEQPLQLIKQLNIQKQLTYNLRKQLNKNQTQNPKYYFKSLIQQQIHLGILVSSIQRILNQINMSDSCFRGELVLGQVDVELFTNKLEQAFDINKAQMRCLEQFDVEMYELRIDILFADSTDEVFRRKLIQSNIPQYILIIQKDFCNISQEMYQQQKVIIPTLSKSQEILRYI